LNGWAIIERLRIDPQEFGDDVCRKAFLACIKLRESGGEINEITVGHEAGLEPIWKVHLLQSPLAMVSDSLARTHRASLKDAYVLRERNALRDDMAISLPEHISRLSGLLSATTETNEPPFVDFEEFLTGTIEIEKPTVGKIWPGAFLFYRGRLNEIHAEPACGKTNVIIATCVQVIHDGGTVVYIDPEDNPRGFIARLLSMGAEPDDIRERIKYLHNPTPEEIDSAAQWSQKNPVQLVVLDGCAEAMAAVGANEDLAMDVLGFFRRYLRPFADAGAAVVVADHVTKNSESRGRWMRGSGAKLGRYDGAVYELVPGEPFTPTKAGFVKMRISKDRCGGAGSFGSIVTEVHFTPGAKGTIVDFRPSADRGEFRPTQIIEKILKKLELGTAGTNELRSLGKSQYVDKAIELLISEGQITKKTEGQKHVFSLAQPSSKTRNTVALEEA
jgi:hypothetical protein